MDIKAAYFINLPYKGILVDLEKEADGWEENRGKYKFDAYLVKLKS
jgi:hypothetical protein